MPPETYSPGDRIILDGYPPVVPMFLAGTRATIRTVTARGSLLVACDGDAYGTRRIKPHMVRRVERDGRWVKPAE